MPPYTSPILRLRLSALGEDLNSWGDPNLNNALKLIEEAVFGPLTLAITGDRVLTADNYVSNEYRRGQHVLVPGAGLAAAFTITVPPVVYVYRFNNRTGFNATIKTASGASAVVRPGMASVVFCDGTDCRVADPTLDQIKTAVGPVNLGGYEIQNAGSATSDTGVPNRGQVLSLTAVNVQLASDWAQKTSSSVDGSTGYSARLWATSTTALSGTGGLKGALGYAQDASGSATLAQQWATVTGAQVAATDYSAKEYAVGTTVPAGSAKSWASLTGGTVAGGEYGAKEYAVGTAVPAGSAKSWATSTGVVTGSLKGALGYAQDASGSASAAATSFLNLDKRYLGAKSADPTTDNQGAALQTGALYFNTTSGLMRAYSGSVWSNVYGVLITGTPLAGQFASFTNPTTIQGLTAAQATANLNAFAGDTGSGGTKGLVPAPASGDAAAGKFLKADGTFAVPGGAGYTQIATVSSPAGVNSVTFSSIPQTYNDLLILVEGVTGNNGGGSLSFGPSNDGTNFALQTLNISPPQNQPIYIAIELIAYRKNTQKIASAGGVAGSNLAVAATAANAVARCAGGATAARLLLSGDNFGGVGAVTLFGR